MYRLVTLAALVWLTCAQFAAATPEADNLSRILRLSEVITIMREEGLDYASDLNEEMLGGQGGQYWTASIKHLYDPDRMEATLRKSIADGMNGPQIAHALAFFETDHGQRILTLEISARTAMFDPDIEEIARARFKDLTATDDAQLAAIARFVEVNDLLDVNVAGALTSSFQFYRGLVDGEALNMSDDEILADVWGQEKEIHDDTKGWLYGFLLMAYRPLSLEEIEAYIVFSETAAGQALNQALFDGFDIVYSVISYELGLTVARAMKASDI